MGKYSKLDQVLKDLVRPEQTGDLVMPPTGMVMVVRDSDRNVLYSGCSNPDFNDQ
jgi:hypothetical protein